MKRFLADAHSVFKVRVKKGRGDRLKDDEYDDIFTGLVWLAGDAKERGLIDDVGNVFDVTKKEFGVDRFIFLENREKSWIIRFTFYECIR